MKVIRASAMGMCFGVKDALQIVKEVDNPSSVTIYGELVHNEEIVTNLTNRGFQSMPETHRNIIPKSQNVLITAHGISENERQKLVNAGKDLIDTTCPLVRYVHESAIRLQKDGYFVIVIGKPKHVEVVGITGDLQQYTVVQSVNEVQSYSYGKLGIICQSTTPPLEALHIRREIERKNPEKELRYVDTICRPTRDRQKAVLELIEQVDCLVVVGGSHSNNTKQLVRLAESHNLPVFHIQTAEDINPVWFKGFQTVGLTAGTSTLDETIEKVHQALLSINMSSNIHQPVYANR